MDRQRATRDRRVDFRAQISGILGQQTGAQPEGNRSLIAAPYGPYQCKGADRWCVIAVYTDDEWQRFARLLETSGLKAEENSRHTYSASVTKKIWING